MILGVSHIVLGSTDLTFDRALFEGLGWTTRFEQRGILTPSGKRPFMSTSSTAQGLVFLQPPTGISVELIHYVDMLPDASASPLQVVLPRPDELEGCRRLAEVAECPGVEAYEVPHVTCPLWFSTDAPVPSTIVHHVSDMDAAIRFWDEGLGFKRSTKPAVPAAPDTITLEFRSVVPHWRATLRLVPLQGPQVPGVLDGPGFRCLSMVASNLERAADDLRRAGASASTGPLDLVINGKPLRLEILRGPDGVFIEILSTSS
jgi:catechol 2,3-dioxygenase-like lactoylglutathione lyase family enzyme